MELGVLRPALMGPEGLKRAFEGKVFRYRARPVLKASFFDKLDGDIMLL